MITATAEKLQGLHILTSDGSTAGEVADVYLDDETGRPKWVTIEVGRLGHKSLVPLSIAAWAKDGLRVPYGKKEIRRAPHANPGVHVSRSLEMRLLEHYGLAGGATLAEARVGADVPARSSHDAQSVTSESRSELGARPVVDHPLPEADDPLSVTA